MPGRLLLLICLLCACLRLSAGELDQFEQSFSPSPKKSSSAVTRHYNLNFDWDDDDSLESGLIEFTTYLVLAGVVAGGAYAEEIADLRPHGDPILTVFQVNGGYQSIDSGLHAWDYSLGAGHGLLAAGFRHTLYRDNRGTPENLDLMQGHLFYRMALHRRAEIALGFGAAWLKGDKSETGFSFASPLRIWPLTWLGLELRPAWAFLNEKTLSDIEASVLLRYRRVSLQTGYRWMEAEDSRASLSGWRTGLSWRF